MDDNLDETVSKYLDSDAIHSHSKSGSVGLSYNPFGLVESLSFEAAKETGVSVFLHPCYQFY